VVDEDSHSAQGADVFVVGRERKAAVGALSLRKSAEVAETDESQGRMGWFEGMSGRRGR
jgi:hypothetical protein